MSAKALLAHFASANNSHSAAGGSAAGAGASAPGQARTGQGQLHEPRVSYDGHGGLDRLTAPASVSMVQLASPLGQPQPQASVMQLPAPSLLASQLPASVGRPHGQQAGRVSPWSAPGHSTAAAQSGQLEAEKPSLAGTTAAAAPLAPMQAAGRVGSIPRGTIGGTAGGAQGGQQGKDALWPQGDEAASASMQGRCLGRRPEPSMPTLSPFLSLAAMGPRDALLEDTAHGPASGPAPLATAGSQPATASSQPATAGSQPATASSQPATASSTGAPRQSTSGSLDAGAPLPLPLPLAEGGLGSRRSATLLVPLPVLAAVEGADASLHAALQAESLARYQR